MSILSFDHYNYTAGVYWETYYRRDGPTDSVNEAACMRARGIVGSDIVGGAGVYIGPWMKTGAKTVRDERP